MSTGLRPLVIGHRGASGYRPEHTRAAYELAFALGADAVEPDIVATKDRVLVLRHENEISGTTDVAEHPEFAHLRTSKVIDGQRLTGWFTEDFTWPELATLRARERLPAVRTGSATFDDRWGILRLTDLMHLIDEQSHTLGRELIMVAELKHATYFASVGLPLDELFAAEIAGWATADNLIVECFEQTVLGQVKQRGIPGRYIYLIEDGGSPADGGPAYAQTLANLAALGGVDGVSVDKSLLLAEPGLVDRAHAAGLLIYTWTLRGENRFLPPNLRRGPAERDYGDWRAEFRTILGTGVDGVFADQPDLALDALQGQ